MNDRSTLESRSSTLKFPEPATMLTDFAIAGICVVFAIGIARAAPGLVSPRGVWALSFVFTTIAAIIGGVVHGFASNLGAAAKQRLWKATQYTIGLTSVAMLAAAVVAFVGGVAERWLLGVAVAKFVAYAAVVGRRDDYSVVVVDYGASMIAMAALAITGWVRSGAPAAPWLIAGVAVSGVAAVVQLKKVTPHPRFNHNDLYHVIQIVALYLFYRGGLLLVDG
ncbi:MAG: hypothetical protein M3282_04650 [Gemmatimonadota bacterium]|nr:hypothetical protein [Gemmatimonadota bacterium]